ncbi:hypothetical protein CSB20_09510, partial [bacterium DOLZORAL124_64_63]
MVVDRIVEMPRRILPERGFLNGRLALVTGGARRIGRQLAQALAEQGADIVLHHNRSAREASETAEELRGHGVRVALLAAHLGDPFQAEDLIHRAIDSMGRPVDILVNNAAIYCPGTARDTSVRSWTEFQNVNLRAPWLLARTMAETLGPTGSGDVINLNDAAALHPRADHFAYTMSKWSLHGLTRNLAMALAPNIRVNELALGSVMPPDPGTGDYQHTPRENIPLDRFPRPEEVAAAMLHLLANAS